MTLIEEIQRKADIIARRCHNDVDFITVYSMGDKEREDYGAINIEINEFGGPKMKNGHIVGDHSDFVSMCLLEEFLKKRLGATLYHIYSGGDIEHHNVKTYRVVF